MRELGVGKSRGAYIVEGGRFAKEAVIELEAGVADKFGVGLKLCALVAGHGLLDLCLVRLADGGVPRLAEVSDALHRGLVGARHGAAPLLLLQ